jgi:hypothetical protein
MFTLSFITVNHSNFFGSLAFNMKRFSIFVLVLIAFADCSAKDISTSGWRLGADRNADWKNDALYLPAEVQLNQMPVDQTTGGWQALNDDQGVSVSLPSTVEDFWGNSARGLMRTMKRSTVRALRSRTKIILAFRGGDGKLMFRNPNPASVSSLPFAARVCVRKFIATANCAVNPALAGQRAASKALRVKLI